MDISSEYEKYYKLTIKYVYEETNEEASPTIIAYYLEGETFGYTSPAINGYTADMPFVRSGSSGMSPKDLEIVVTYTKNAIPEPPQP